MVGGDARNPTTPHAGECDTGGDELDDEDGHQSRARREPATCKAPQYRTRAQGHHDVDDALRERQQQVLTLCESVLQFHHKRNAAPEQSAAKGIGPRDRQYRPARGNDSGSGGSGAMLVRRRCMRCGRGRSFSGGVGWDRGQGPEG